jgi:hypothetical protein
MTAVAAVRSAASPLDIIAEFYRREPRFAAMGVMMILLLLPTGFAALIDPREIGGESVWTKPLKFQLSLAAYLLTLAWFAAWLPAQTAGRRWYRPYSIAVVVMVALEVVWLMGAAANGVPSHFNRGGGVLETIYPVMGLIAIGLTSATLTFGVLIGRDRESRLAPVLREAVSLGLVLTFVLTVLAAGFLAVGTGHFVGETAASARSVPFLGWARDGGDLRVAHFFATHAMHIIPVAGLAALALPARSGLIAVRLFCVAFVVFVAGLLIQASRGIPFI